MSGGDHLRDLDDVERMSRAELEAHAKALRTACAVTDAVLGAAEASEITARAIEAVIQTTSLPGVAIFELDPSAQRLRLVDMRGLDESTLRRDAMLALDGSLAGLAVRRRQLVTSDDLGRDSRADPSVREQAVRQGFRGMAAMPLVADGRVIGALNVFHHSPSGLTAHERVLVEAVAHALSVALDRAHGTQRRQRWREFLSEASVALASSLDYQATLAQVARLAVRGLADWCVVDVVQPDGTVARVAGAHADPTKQPLIDELLRVTAADATIKKQGILSMRIGRTVVRSDIDDEQLGPGPVRAVATSDPEHLRMLRTLEMRAFVSAPLRARGKIFGAIGFVSNDPARFAHEDVERAEELAQRCALALDNARLYHEACDAIAVREDFISVASHELRTPLTALQLGLQTIERRSLGEPVAGALARATQQVRRLTALVDSLLDVSRIASSRLTLHIEHVDLGDVVSDVVDRLRGEAARAHCTIQVRVRPVRGRWDKLKIDQAASNLVANAIKYGAGKPVEIDVDEAGASARVTVRDHGIGIAEEDAARVFDRFERAVSSRHYGGLGLGLYIARRFIEAQGGSISVASKPGEGSTFTVLLPRTP